MTGLDPIGEAVLIAREGRRLRAYADIRGVWTIGIGMTTIDGRPVRRGDAITAAECDALFEQTVARYAAAVDGAVMVPITDNERGALVSVCYNIGIAGFKGSTFLRRLNAGDRAGCRDAMLMWKEPAAIIPRRQAEAEQFVTPYAAALPRPTFGQASIKGVAAAADAPATVVPPVFVPPSTNWIDRIGAWVDWVFAPSGVPGPANHG